MLHPADVTEEVQLPLDNSVHDIDACAHSFHDICILDFLLPLILLSHSTIMSKT